MTQDLTRRAFLQFLAAVLILPETPRAAFAAAKTVAIPVLLYHDISPEHTDDYTLPPALFAAQMEWLCAEGYRAVSFADLASSALPERACIITFDDGYASFIPYALPFLQAYGFKATINIIGQHVASHIKDGIIRPMLAWDEYRYLAATGLVDFGCHTERLHVYRHQGAAGVADSVLLEDLAQFQKNFVREMGKRCDILAWPYGFYTEKSVATARKAGFRYLLTSKRGVYLRTDAPWDIPRNNITPDDNLLTFPSIFEVS